MHLESGDRKVQDTPRRSRLWQGTGKGLGVSHGERLTVEILSWTGRGNPNRQLVKVDNENSPHDTDDVVGVPREEQGGEGDLTADELK